MTERRIVVFDVETTGTDKRQDQVIELCVQLGIGADAPSRTWRIKPSVEIGPGAQAVHGISMADLADCPKFDAVAEEIRALFAEAEVLVGYNLSFDVEMLQAEYRRLRLPMLDLADKLIVDPFRLWQQCEPRTLQDAHRRFVGEAFSDAHSASADVAATGRVLAGMLEHFQIARDWNRVAAVCEPERALWIGPSRHVQWGEDGSPVLSFGKHAGTPLARLAAGPDAGYLRWILDKDFPAHVHELCEQALASGDDELLAWIERIHGPCPRPAAERSSTGSADSTGSAAPAPKPTARVASA